MSTTQSRPHGAAARRARPRVLLVGGTRYRLPLEQALRTKFDALGAVVDLRIVARVAAGVIDGDTQFRLVRGDGPGRALFPLRLALAVRREARRSHPAVVVAESPHFGFLAIVALAGAPWNTRLAVEVHGDWRVASRLYGSPARKWLGPLADIAARQALRRAAVVRAVSRHLSDLVRSEAGRPADTVFPTFSDLGRFTDRPPAELPDEPTVLFVGALEPVKGVDTLLRAWPHVVDRAPEARLEIVGDGHLAELVADLEAKRPSEVSWTRVLDPTQVAARMDAATVLVLPSRSEGLPRVIIEAQARGRGVVASRVGGIPELVKDGESGLLVAPGDASALADALTRSLREPGLAARLGAEANRRFPFVAATPETFAARFRELIDRALAG